MFLAHSSQDKPQARDFYELLTLDGFSTWFDEENLVPGQNWRAEISTAVSSTDAVVILLSESSTTRAGYLHKEISLALDLAEEQPERSIFIVPVVFGSAALPDRLKHLHCLRTPGPDFPLGESYLDLQHSLLLRACQIGLGKWEFLTKQRARFHGEMKQSAARNHWENGAPTFSFIVGTYLIRGRNPGGAPYYGLANIRERSRKLFMESRISRQSLVYEGRVENGLLVFHGAHSVVYRLSTRGVCVGQWGDGGTEELIPASQYVRVRPRTRR